MSRDEPKPDAPESLRAEVYVGALRIEYRRAGAGPAVLLLRAARNEASFHWLALRCRVFEPLHSGPAASGDGSLTTSIRGFLDGLGLQRVAILADGALAAEALWLAISDPDRVARVVIVVAGKADPHSTDALSLEPLERSGLAVLLVRAPGGLDRIPAAERERVLRFVAASDRPPLAIPPALHI
jgi:pimeloyl-ACP methyl ester carboxylesterase